MKPSHNEDDTQPTERIECPECKGFGNIGKGSYAFICDNCDGVGRVIARQASEDHKPQSSNEGSFTESNPRRRVMYEFDLDNPKANEGLKAFIAAVCVEITGDHYDNQPDWIKKYWRPVAAQGEKKL